MSHRLRMVCGVVVAMTVAAGTAGPASAATSSRISGEPRLSGGSPLGPDAPITTTQAERPLQSADNPSWIEDVEAFYAARGNQPIWHDESGLTERGRALSAELSRASDWGLDPTAYRITPTENLEAKHLIAADVRLTFAALRYAHHAQNGRIEPAALSRWLAATPKPFAAASVLAGLTIADDPAEALRHFHPQHAGFHNLRLAWLKLRDGPQSRRKDLFDRILTNMERWRWLPADLGDRYVWNNIPAFETTLVDGDLTVFRERLIVGTTRTQTPVFSDLIRFIVFQPDWGVPPSLKVRDLLPRLSAGDTSVLVRRDMRIVGKDPHGIDWSSTDIRRIPIVQNPGPSNPLGRMKFMFPNRHDVYMHDTPDKSAFGRKSRALSNGCIRVRNPARLAEHLLAVDRGWMVDDIARMTARPAPENNRVDLVAPVPVHNVYFTVTALSDGVVESHADIYDHDRRVLEALKGEPLDRIAARDPALAHEREIKRLMEAKAVPPPRVRDVYEKGYAPPPASTRGYAPPATAGAYPPWARRLFGF